MTRNRSNWTMALALTIAGVTAPAYAQQISDARIKELVRQAAEQVGNRGTVQTPTGAPQPPTRIIPLTLDEAVKAALDNNLDVTVQRLNPQISDISFASLRAVYLPSITSQLATQDQTNASTSTIAGGARPGAPIETGLTTFNAGILQAVPWGGGSYQVLLNNNKATTASLNTLFNPTFNTNWSAAYTQPLMRGFKIDSNRQQIQVTRINRDITDVQLRATITNILSNVRNAYWNYVFAVQTVAVAQTSVNLATRLVQDNQTRVQVGTMAPIDVVTAQSQAATARQNLVTAQGNKRTSELALKRLIVNGTQDPLWNATIDPVERAEFAPVSVDLESAVRRALSERTDLAIARKNLEANNVTLSYLNNQLLPQADLIGTYGLLGLGGSQLITTGTGVNQVQIGSIPGGYGDALTSLFNSRYPRWNVTMNLSYPIGLSSAKATVARARVQLNQDQAQLKQIELQVATDVTNAIITVQSNAERVQAAQAARQLAQQQLDAENAKFEVGMSTNFLVVTAQSQLAASQNNELQAILNYRIGLVELERLQQTTLTNLNITLVSPAVR